MGHLAINTEWFLRKRNYKGLVIKPYTIIISPKVKKNMYVANVYLLKEYVKELQKDCRIFTIESSILHRVMHSIKIINHRQKKNYYLPSNHIMNNDFSKTQKVINLSNNDISRGRVLLKNLGVTEFDRIVVIFARDSEYLSKRFTDKDWSYHDYRNADIGTYIKSINYLIEIGYTVIRVGSVVKDKVNFNHPKFIDYPFSSCKSDFLDVLIIYLSKFVIGTTSGATDMALTFNKPFLGVNYAPFTESPLGRFDQYIQKKLVDNESKMVIKYKDFLGKECLSEVYNSKEFSKKYNLSYKDNTEDEILDAVIEFENRNRQLSFTESNKCSDLLNKYNSMYWKHMPSHLIEPKISCSWLKKHIDLYT